jgi:hypothetical protein
MLNLRRKNKSKTAMDMTHLHFRFLVCQLVKACCLHTPWKDAMDPQCVPRKGSVPVPMERGLLMLLPVVVSAKCYLGLVDPTLKEFSSCKPKSFL